MVSASVLLAWLNEVRRGGHPCPATVTAYQELRDIPSADYAQLLSVIRPDSRPRFTFVVPDNAREAAAVTLANFRAAVAECAANVPAADAPGLPAKLCAGDEAAHHTLMTALHSRRFSIQKTYDWSIHRRTLESAELLSGAAPVALDPARPVCASAHELEELRLLRQCNKTLAAALEQAFSFAVYLPQSAPTTRGAPWAPLPPATEETLFEVPLVVVGAELPTHTE